MEEEIAHICDFYKTIDKIDNTKSFGVKKEYIAPSSLSTIPSPIPTSSTSGSPQPTTSNQRKRTDLKINEVPCKKPRCVNLQEKVSEDNHNLENISTKIDILAKSNSVDRNILEKIVNKLNNIDNRLGNLEKKYDKIIELEIKKLEIISQHNVLKDIRIENNASPILEVQTQPCLPNNHESNNAEEHCYKSSENIVEIINFDIKEEYFSDSDDADELEVKNMIEICDTEYIKNEDVVEVFDDS